MDKMTKQVVSMLVSSDKITLFTITGELIEIKNDEDYDTAKISEFLTPKLSGLGAVEISLADFARVTQLLPSDLEEHGISITQIINGREVQGIFYPRKVAVEVSVGTDKIVIPDVENLTGHIKRAVAESSPSVANFLKRLAPVIKSRKHSGEDLMKFIKESEMPLTNDGRIIAYKRVNAHETVGYFKDCHTGKVKQRVGSRVTMDVDLVDSSRHNSCSTGLHVANLGYMKSFSGAHTLIVLVNPEDFIAVPHNENTKARVCAYEIIGVMSQNAHGIVGNTHVNNDADLKKLIKNAVEGNSFKPIEEVRVGRHGEMLATKPLTLLLTYPVTPVAKSSGKSLREDKVDVVQATRDTMEVTRAAVAQGTALAIPEEVVKAFDLLLSGVSKNQVADRFETSSRSIGRWMEKYDFDAYKAAKEAAPTQPYPTEPEADDEEEEETSPTHGDYQGDHEAGSNTNPHDEPTQEELEDTAAFVNAVVANGGTNEGMGTMMPEPETPKEATPVSDDDFAKLVQSSEAPKTNKVDQMRKLYNNWVLGGFKEADLNAVKLFKSASKKSYSVLGLTTAEVQKIQNAD